MAWTYTTLKQAIYDYLENNNATFVGNIDVIITQAEDRILKNVQLPDFRKAVTGSTTANDQYLQIPDDFLAVYSMAVDNSGYEYLLYKDVSFIREVYPNADATGTPAYYGIWDDDYFILGPTPDAAYAVELHYFHKPESITVAASGTTWLGDNAESTLFAACLLEAYIFLKGDADQLKVYETRYKEALEALKILGEGRNRTDQYRSG